MERIRYFEPWLVDYIPLSGDVFIDVGANEGIYTLDLADGYKKVIAIEPDRRALDKLERKIVDKGLQDKIDLWPVAVWSYDGLLELNMFEKTVHTGIMQSGLDRGECKFSQAIECYRLDSIWVRSNMNRWVDFIKIDTEGAEYDIVCGGYKVIRAFFPRILIEVHNHENKIKLLDFFSQLKGYKTEVIRHPHYPPNSEYWDHHMWLYCYYY